MGQDDRIDLLGRDREVTPVPLAPFFFPLKKTAIDKYLQAASMNKVFGTRNRSGSPQELYVVHETLYTRLCKSRYCLAASTV